MKSVSRGCLAGVDLNKALLLCGPQHECRVGPYLWQDAGADVIARQFPEGVAVGTTVVVYRWADGERAEKRAQ